MRLPRSASRCCCSPTRSLPERRKSTRLPVSSRERGPAPAHHDLRGSRERPRRRLKALSPAVALQRRPSVCSPSSMRANFVPCWDRRRSSTGLRAIDRRRRHGQHSPYVRAHLSCSKLGSAAEPSPCFAERIPGLAPPISCHNQQMSIIWLISSA